MAPVKFTNLEDRLNPAPLEGIDDGTLGGYPAVYGRAPGFEGSDGHAYTVAVEVEPADDGTGEWVAYLVFLRWAAGGGAIMGHLESGDLAHGPSGEAARESVGELSLRQVKAVLEELIGERLRESGEE
ncbi:MAG: hypothetical protein LBG44_07675 [Gemmatimonadota bacterium]|nr:hypothetical protein [Gemmatimonadota bacterium]